MSPTQKLMPDKSLIDNLYFGKESAESETKFLDKVFVPTSFFKRTQKGQKLLVLGRKGAGKTALCLKLFNALTQQNKTVSLITPRNLSKFKVSVLREGSLNLSESSLLSWKYVFFTEIGFYILDAAKNVYGDNYAVWPENIKRVRKFLANNIKKHANWIDKTFKVVSSVKKLGLKIFDVELELGSISQEAVNFTDTLDDITNDIASSLAILMKEPIYILVDKVDEIWESGEESSSLIVGLLQASKEITDQIEFIEIVVFLRSDIFDSLKFHDSDKFHSLEERILWSKSDLKKLVALRARASTQLKMRRDAVNKILLEFFPANIDNKDTFEYLLEYTLMRPRDLIQLCNLCRDKAQNNGHSSIETSDIHEALPQYSRWKLRDLRDEYQVQYPFLEKVFLGVFQHAPAILHRDDISERIFPIRDRLAKEYDSFYFSPLDNLLQILYSIGFLGVSKNGKGLYNFLDDAVVIPYMNEFEIHPAFRFALEVNIQSKKKFNLTGIEHSQIAVVGNYNVIGTGGNIQISNIFEQRETEVLDLIKHFESRQIASHLLNTDKEFILPKFTDIQQNYRNPDIGISVDIMGLSNDLNILIEIKNRDIRAADLHQLVSYGMLAKAQTWLISFRAISPRIIALARKLGVFITGPDQWEEFKRIIEKS